MLICFQLHVSTVAYIKLGISMTHLTLAHLAFAPLTSGAFCKRLSLWQAQIVEVGDRTWLIQEK